MRTPGHQSDFSQRSCTFLPCPSENIGGKTGLANGESGLPDSRNPQETFAKFRFVRQQDFLSSGPHQRFA